MASLLGFGRDGGATPYRRDDGVTRMIRDEFVKRNIGNPSAGICRTAISQNAIDAQRA
jgi:hypothetical protein